MSTYTILPKSSLGYEKVKLKTVCLKILGGGTPSTKNDTFWNGSIPWISSADIIGLKEINPRRKITLEAVNGSTANILPKGGIIVVTRVGLGKLAIAPYDICFSQDNQGLILDETKISQSYALLCLSKAVEKFKHESRGTTINGVTKKQLELLEIPLPSLQEQDKLVSKVEELFSELDKSIEMLRLAQQQLKTYRQAVLKWAFEGKLTKEWRKESRSSGRIESRSLETYMTLSGIEPELLAAETSADYKVAGNNAELPDGWRWLKLRDLAKVISGFAFKSTDFKSVGIPVIKISNIGYSQFLWKEQQYLPQEFLKLNSDYVIKSGDILIALTRPITNDTTKVCQFPIDTKKGLLNQRVACIKELKINKSFLFMYLQTKEFKRYIRTKFSETLQPNLSPKDFANTLVPTPSIEEQEFIIKEIESRFSVADKMEESITQSLQQAEALRQSILKKAFEGTLNNG